MAKSPALFVPVDEGGNLERLTMPKKNTEKHPWLTLAITALLLTVANDSRVKLTSTIQAQDGGQENQITESRKIKSVVLKTFGNTRMGILYRKEFTLTNTDSEYTLAYSCRGVCDCTKAEREVEQSFAEEFLRDVETLADLGEKGRCCDRPWTEIKLNYVDGSSKTLASVGDIGAAGYKVFNFNKVCASVESELNASIANRKIPAGLVITYDDMHPLSGGTTIVIRGSGGVERRVRLKKESKAKVTRANVSRLQLLELIQQLIKLKAWEQHTPNRQPVADETRATLTINVNGQTSESWEWFNEISKNNRLIQVKEKMLALK